MAAMLMLLTVFGPLSMDLYLPVLPELARDLEAPASAAQLTVTACLIGLASGQLVAGPLSDRFGRRRPLIVGILAYIAASVLCAFSPGMITLVLARFAQGLAGATGIVIAQASGRDVYEGGALIAFYARLTGLGGFAAIVGPLLGGQLARIMDWRGVFLVLAGIGVLLLMATLVIFTETHAPHRRTGVGAGTTLHNFVHLLGDRPFLCLVLVMGLVHAALFSYVAGATFILQETYGLSPQGYSYAFGVNSLGVIVFSQLGGRAARRWGERPVIGFGITVLAVSGLGLLAAGLLELPVAAVLIFLFALVAAVSATAPPLTALALGAHPEMAGTASSLLGMARYGFGGGRGPAGRARRSRCGDPPRRAHGDRRRPRRPGRGRRALTRPAQHLTPEPTTAAHAPSATAAGHGAEYTIVDPRAADLDVGSVRTRPPLVRYASMATDGVIAAHRH